MNNADISSALLLLAQQQQQQQQQSHHQQAFTSSQGPSKAALLSLLSGQANLAPHAASDSSSDAMILQLLQHQAQQKQKEEQEKILLLQKLQQELSKPQVPSDDLALLSLLQQQKHQQLSNFASLGGGANPLLSASNMSANLVANPQANQLDAATLAKLLSGQAPPVAAAPAFAAAAAQPSVESFGNNQLQVSGGKRKGRTGTFPAKLHQMLSDLERQEGGTDIASFLPHGRAFAIHKPRDFVKHVMPKYFRMSRFSSFQRQLNLYDFQRITEGPDKGSYYHELFVKGRPILSTMMKRNKIKGIKNKKLEANNNADADAHEVAEEDEGEEEEM